MRNNVGHNNNGYVVGGRCEGHKFVDRWGWLRSGWVFRPDACRARHVDTTKNRKSVTVALNKPLERISMGYAMYSVSGLN